jgi:hypothetical protein
MVQYWNQVVCTYDQNGAKKKFGLDLELGGGTGTVDYRYSNYVDYGTLGE